MILMFIRQMKDKTELKRFKLRVFVNKLVDTKAPFHDVLYIVL